jgi:hypothetical protein
MSKSSIVASPIPESPNYHGNKDAYYLKAVFEVLGRVGYHRFVHLLDKERGHEQTSERKNIGR